MSPAVRFVVLSAVWGGSFLFIKVGDEAFAPIQVAFGRVFFGTITVLVLLAATGTALPRSRDIWRHAFVAALLLNSLPFWLFAYGETRISSVLAGIINATTPLLTLIVACWVIPEERPTRERMAGLVVGFAGVLVLLDVWQGFGGAAFAGEAACFVAAVCYGFGFPYARKHLAGRGDAAITLVAAQLVCATAQLGVLMPVVSGLPTHFPARPVAAVLTLGVFGTCIAYAINYSLIRDLGATLASTVTYVVPLFATVAGVVILGERVAWYEPVGGVIVLSGVAVAQGYWRRIRLAVRVPAASGRARPDWHEPRR